jgi:hypothetical protein
LILLPPMRERDGRGMEGEKGGMEEEWRVRRKGWKRNAECEKEGMEEEWRVRREGWKRNGG